MDVLTDTKSHSCGLILTLFGLYQSQEAESKPQCRRLQLKDIIPTEMQRLTKYPLLLENIAKNTGVYVRLGYKNSVFASFQFLSYWMSVLIIKTAI